MMKFCIQAYPTPTKRLKQIKKGLNFGRLPKHKFKVITDLDKSLDKDQDLDQDQDLDENQNYTRTKNMINQKIILSELNIVADLACLFLYRFLYWLYPSNPFVKGLG